jgi:hypothetical protein
MTVKRLRCSQESLDEQLVELLLVLRTEPDGGR